MLTQLTEDFKSKGCARTTKPRNVIVGESLQDANIWFEPDESEVWEVMAADLSISPVHTAALGKVSEDKGIALRFPRFLRRRDDKAPSDATTADQVAQMYRNQGTTMLGMAGGDEDD
jgi:DNA ligase 1